jgi:hypothetical protein
MFTSTASLSATIQAYSIGRPPLKLRLELGAHHRQAGPLEQLFEILGGDGVDEHGHAEPRVGLPRIVPRLRAKQDPPVRPEQFAEPPEEGGIVLPSDVVDQIQGEDRVEGFIGEVDLPSVAMDEGGRWNIRPRASNLLL